MSYVLQLSSADLVEQCSPEPPVSFMSTRRKSCDMLSSNGHGTVGSKTVRNAVSTNMYMNRVNPWFISNNIIMYIHIRNYLVPSLDHSTIIFRRTSTRNLNSREYPCASPPTTMPSSSVSSWERRDYGWEYQWLVHAWIGTIPLMFVYVSTHTVHT